MKLTLRVFLPDEPKAIDVEGATVQWVQGGTFGLETLKIAAPAALRIRKFIDSMTSLPGSTHVA
jgi:hypothetical protein